MNSALRSYKDGYLWLSVAEGPNSSGYYVAVFTKEDAAEILRQRDAFQRQKQAYDDLLCHQYLDLFGDYYEDWSERLRMDTSIREIHDDGVIWSWCPKHSSDTITTTTLSYDLIERMAKGERIPPPKLTPEEQKEFENTFGIPYEDFIDDDIIQEYAGLEPPVP